jgi:putative DNA primase/helicase
VNLEEVAGHFDNVKRSGAGLSARCSVHEDRNNSLSLSDGDIGVQVFCHVCGKDETENVLAAAGLTFKDLMSNGNGHAGQPFTIAATYDYHDKDGRLVYQVCRLSPKSFRQRRPDGAGGWTWNLNGTKRLLYHLPELLAADPATVVHVVEGEKDADRLREAGLLATCNSGGAGKWPEDYNDIFKGRYVVNLPDHDRPGIDHAHDVARHLHGIAASVKIVNLYNGPIPDKHGRDVYDWLTEGHDLEELVRLEEAAQEWTPETKTPEVEPTGPELPTDLGNARRLVRLHGDHLRHVQAWRSWRHYDGKRWAEDETRQVERCAKETVASMYREAGALFNDEDRKRAAAHAIRTESASAIGAMITLAASEPGIALRRDQFDADLWALNCDNGTLNLKTGELRPHHREDLISRMVAAAYIKTATCPEFMKVISRVMGEREDMIGFLRRAIGYALSGSTKEQCLFVLWGSGQNGKSTLVNIVCDLLADYATVAASDVLLARRRDEHPASVAVLEGARFVAAFETDDGRRLAEGLVKQLTGGDKVSARKMRENPHAFTPRFKLFLACNHKPVIKGTDKAIWRRIKLIPFTVTIPDAEQDKDLPDRLRAELPGILAWAVQGCLEWQRDGLNPPQDVTDATATYRDEMDLVGRFLTEECTTGEEHEVTKKNLYAAFKAWADQSGESHKGNPPLSQKAFSQRMAERGTKSGKDREAHYWEGVSLSSQPTLTSKATS